MAGTFGVEVLDGIGSSEAYHIYISNRPGRARPSSTGELVPGYDAHIAENGELWIEGDTAALLYWGEHEKTKETFHGDRVRTGDLFERDADGYFWYRGRADDLIKVGGIWVAPAEIEHAWSATPPSWSAPSLARSRTASRSRALRRRREPLEEQELVGFARGHLAGHKVPREIRFVDDLPRTPPASSTGRPALSRLVVVTGGTKGIGKAVADRFAAQGTAVEAVGRDRLDVTDEQMVGEFFEQAGPVDVLVNNAGVAWSTPLQRTTLEDWHAHRRQRNRGVPLHPRGDRRHDRARRWAHRDRGIGGGLVGSRYTAAYAASSTPRSADARRGRRAAEPA